MISFISCSSFDFDLFSFSNVQSAFSEVKLPFKKGGGRKPEINTGTSPGYYWLNSNIAHPIKTILLHTNLYSNYFPDYFPQYFPIISHVPAIYSIRTFFGEIIGKKRLTAAENGFRLCTIGTLNVPFYRRFPMKVIQYNRRPGFQSNRKFRNPRLRRRKINFLTPLLIGLAAVAVGVGCFFLFQGGPGSGQKAVTAAAIETVTPSAPAVSAAAPSASPSASESPVVSVAAEPPVEMAVAPVAGTKPSDFKLKTSIFADTKKVSSYTRPDPISFSQGSAYTKLPGIITFRGNNYREGASYGTVEVAKKQLAKVKSVATGSVRKSGGSGSWTGSGWTGQPLIVKWPEETKKIMNLYPEKKADPDLVEVIYPCLDGKIYFLDLKDMTPTRPPIKTKAGPIKGTASLYPSGIPMLFVGQGDALPGGSVKYRIYSLIDQKLLKTFGTKDPNKLRGWEAYDSSALIDAKTDTLIEPGENGLLYTIKLNTKYDPKAGTLTIKPDPPVKFRYTSSKYGENKFWWGFEDSAVAYKNYLYLTDNGGTLFCIDLNTMKLVWAQSTLDDSNSTPLFEESAKDGTCYIYTSTSMHFTAKGSGSSRKGTTPIWKIDASNGRYVWSKPPKYTCYTKEGVSGGVEGTGILGKNDISNLVIYPVARTPSFGSGLLVAIEKETGKEAWRTPFKNYLWSSPVAVYTKEGKSFIVQCDTGGKMHLLDGKSGAILDTVDLGGNIEASPAVYGNTIVVGTRRQKIWQVKIE
jgi:outer membrane protein assembly factor BamB